MSQKAPKRSCIDHAIMMLGRRAYAFNEMLEKLQKKYSLEEAQAAAERLKELGYLDDAKFAKQRVVSRAEYGTWGRAKIEQELRRKGIANEHIEAAFDYWKEGADMLLDGEEKENSWHDKASKVLLKKYGPWPAEFGEAGDEPSNWEGRKEEAEKIYKEKTKRLNFLVRQGFSYDEAKFALEESIKNS